ncbi:type IX secretion system membrane protein, PorP/SprF family [Filimonas lacunae]|uniref:Type IX secretion system membrane protein, PorP/SprF family n=1 Tax=Filimonas lacunae TaxID=477680 RepID=A0A173MEF1_9BACT|nr:type IX secretion system membrane protein PorP/SprF [Filimonas lacunae]BAV05897.1 hypothetical protein FLA_1909 [Filimonas lacunae]SIT34552.1 type IX secretion system membrane protein, PorP/SprF family [Filimonas lacunae]
MKKLLVLILMIFELGLDANAQQDAMYSQYMFNTLAINPAYAGSRNVLSATALYRRQWVGIDGAPKTGTISVDAPVSSKNLGLGLQIISDKIGVTSTTGINTSYAYKIHTGKGTLSVGLQAGWSQYKGDYMSSNLEQGTDVPFKQNVNKSYFNFGTGLYYSTSKWYIGLSAPQLLNNVALVNNQLHMFLAAGYVFPIGDDFKLKPSILLKGVEGAPLEADLNATLWILDLVAVGAQYRTKADVAGMVEVQVLPQLRLGYSYDRSTTTLSNYNSGSHELMVRFEFGFEKDRVLSPRYF